MAQGRGSAAPKQVSNAPKTTTASKKSRTDNNGCLPVTPFNITLGILNTETRRQPEAWTTILLYPDDNSEASVQEGTKTIHKLQNLHNTIAVAFRELKEIMESGKSIPWELKYGKDGKTWKVLLKFSFAYVIGDTEMHDKLCGRYGPRTRTVKSICRHCTCTTGELCKGGEIFEGFDLYTPEMLDPETHSPEYFKSISHHPIRNAFHDLDFGANRFNIHLASPGELLHMVQKGVCTRSIEGFVQMWKDPKIEQDDVTAVTNQKKSIITLDCLDRLGKVYGGYLSRQSDRNKPRTKFRSSLFKNCKKNGHEHTGVIMDVLCAILSNRGRQIIAERGVDERWIENYVYLFEVLLQLEQFMKMKHVPLEYTLDERLLGKAMDHLLETIDGTIHRGEKTMGNMTAKNHLLAHLPQYASRFGPLTGMDSGDSERNHKFQVKHQARWTQRRDYSFQGQFGTRWSETRLVTRAVNRFRKVHGLFMERIDEDESDGDEDDIGDNDRVTLGGSHFEIGINEHGKPAMGWRDEEKRGKVTHPQPVVDFLCHEVLKKIESNTILGRTEFNMVIAGERNIFRAHPNYRSDCNQRVHMWYDWAEFKFVSRSGKSLILPGQIAAIVEIGALQGSPKVRSVQLIPNKAYAVVRLFKREPRLDFRESCSGTGAQYTYSVRWGQVRDGFYLLPLETITGTTIVVPNEPEDPDCQVRCEDPLDGGFFVIPSREALGEDFMGLIERESVEIQRTAEDNGEDDEDEVDEEDIGEDDEGGEDDEDGEDNGVDGEDEVEEEDIGEDDEGEEDDEDGEDDGEDYGEDYGEDGEDEGDNGGDDQDEEDGDNRGDSDEDTGDEDSLFANTRRNFLSAYMERLTL